MCGFQVYMYAALIIIIIMSTMLIARSDVYVIFWKIIRSSLSRLKHSNFYSNILIFVEV